MAPPSLDTLPGELVLHIMSYLDPRDAARFQRVSRQLRTTARNAGFWRTRCFDDSKFVPTLLRRQRLFGRPEDRNGAGGGRPSTGTTGATGNQRGKTERIRLLANWDPVFPSEPVSWYDEYIQRNAPIAVNWFELPRRGGGSSRLIDNADVIEVRGVALYRPGGGRSADDRTGDRDIDDDDGRLAGLPTLWAVAPLEDGSVCLWDVNGTVGRRGAIVQKSRPGLLFVGIEEAEHGGASPHPFELGVTECVSVDSARHLAYFAVQNRLVEVDLQTLSVVGVEVFPWAITALSAAHPSVPLSVGTARGIHMHDPRARAAFRSVDDIMTGSAAHHHNHHHHHRRPPRCAPYPQPGPLSILHLQRPGGGGSSDGGSDLSDDIYAAGRIPSILHYDRRNLAAIKDSIHSGASLCGLASLPHPFSTLDHDLRREGRLSLAQVERSKAAPGGRTIVACGEYKSKGSLEVYGTGPAPASESEGVVEYRQNATMKNRQTSSFSKLFSVASHGARLVVSDGAGLIKWFERDGFTEVRRCRLGGDDYDEDAASDLGDGEGDGHSHGHGHGHAGRPSSTAAAEASSDLGDIARKLLPTQLLGSNGGGGGSGGTFVNNDLLFWTGEKLGLVSFSPKPGFRSDDFVEDAKTAEERATEKEGRAYRTKMRQLFKSARYFGGDSDSDD